jgi:hypothetical protein
MTEFLYILTVCAWEQCVTYAVENRALCEAAMRLAYDDLYDDTGGDLYIVCDQTNVLTSTIRPEARP